MVSMKEEQDRLAGVNLKLKDKVSMLCDVVRLSWEQHQEKLFEAETLIEELQDENIELRKLLEIHIDGSTVEEIERSLRQ